MNEERLDADTAIVEFDARYKRNGRAGRLHEISRFLRERGRWYYVDAVEQSDAAKRPKDRRRN